MCENSEDYTTELNNHKSKAAIHYLLKKKKFDQKKVYGKMIKTKTVNKLQTSDISHPQMCTCKAASSFLNLKRSKRGTFCPCKGTRWTHRVPRPHHS